MTEEVAAQPEVEQEQSTAPEAITDAPKEVEESQAEEKHFTQAELDAIVQKRIAKAEAVAERRALKVYAEKLESMQRPQQQAPQPQNDGKPTMGQYSNVEDYVEAVADWKLAQRDQITQQSAAEMSRNQITEKANKIYAEADKLGFDRETFDTMELSVPVAQAIIDSDIAPQLVTFLAKNPEEAARIVKLSPARQAAEIGKLEAKLSVAAVKASSAPAPIKPVGNRGGNTSGDPSRMSMEEYQAFRAKQGARWAR
jgi:hypothetical protein